MLDFYAADAHSKVKRHLLGPEERIGGLEVEEYASMESLWQRVRVAGVRAEYMKDFFLTTEQIVTAVVAINHLAGGDGQQVWSKMRAILIAAADRDCGLLAVSD